MNINLHQLELFLLVADLRGFTKAARAQHLSPSALSRSIHQLETQLGVLLFARDTRNVVLTPEGTEFVLVARRLVQERDRGLQGFDQFINGQRGRVTIASLPSVFVSTLAPIVADFQAAHPDADLVILDGSAGRAVEAVRAGQADLALSTCLLPDSELSAEPMFRDRFFVVCRRDHPLGKSQDGVPWKQLADYPFIACDPKSSVRFFTDTAFLQAGVQVQNRYEPATLPVIGSLVAHGLGLTALPELSLPPVLTGYPVLMRRPLIDPTLERTICLLTKIGHSRSPLLRAFLAFLRREIARRRSAPA